MEVTAKFISDEKFKIFDSNIKKEKILVIGQVQSGKTKFMIEQSALALESDFDLAIILGGTNNNLLNQTKNRFAKEFSIGDYSIFDSSDMNYNRIPKNKTLIVCLKGKTSLEKLISLIDNSFERKAIVFDDESDFGGIDIGKGKPSTIYRLLEEVYEKLEEVKYVSVTATPFADILSKDSNKYRRAHALIPNEEYTGSSFFIKNEHIYQKIDKDEIDEKDWLKILIDHIKRVKDFGKDETQMLINNSLETYEHMKTQIKIFEYLDFIRGNFTTLGLSQHKDIIDEICENVVVLNQENNSISFSKKHSIIIGGALVSRGYTFEKLLTALMINTPKLHNSADTLMQRARWFGYRKNDDIYKFMKVYLPFKVYSALIECNTLTNDVYKMIEDNETIHSVKNKISKIKFDFIKPTGKAIN